MPHKITELLNSGIEANQKDKFRQGNLIRLPAHGDIVITGDIHGHRRNFERIVAFADLANHPDRHIVLQEIIHGGPEDLQGGCLSYQLLFDVIRYKLDFPDRVHTILSNHDTAFINNADIMKDGREMNRAMTAAMQREFGKTCDDIILVARQFLFSQALAVKTENRIWASHSLPADRYLDKFDLQIFDRQLKVNDVVKPGSAYLLTWGRHHSQELLNKMAELLDVDIFVIAHQPQEGGWLKAAENLLIIASDHNHGCLLNADLTKPPVIEMLIKSIVPLASIS
jgi:hypothetical protein